ncbi:MAG TPA: Bax inhibitor-1 family protein [Burkholderiales bacterium]|jgi:modulator of FtsH protease|nr:Bax inhibitor-1 family protein [Burkholderiales bacterium]
MELKPVRTDDQTSVREAGRGVTYESTHDVAASDSSRRVLRNTYLLLAASLVPTAIGAVVGTNLDLSFLHASPIVASFAILAIFYGWIFAIEKNKTSGLGVGLLLGFTAFMGLLLGPLLHAVLGFSNGVQLVAMAAGGTAAAFFGLAGVASTTKRDFGVMGNFLTVGAIVIMLAVVANIFFQSPVVYLALLGAFIIFSSLLILWQINAIVRGGETNYISATLSLYISLYNLFSSLLQLLGIFGGNRD